MSRVRTLPGLTHPLSGCVGVLATRGLWFRVCPQRTAFGFAHMGRGAAVLYSARAAERRQ